MRTRMVVTAAAVSVALSSPALALAAPEAPAPAPQPAGAPAPEPRVVADGLNNPRQLSWSSDGEEILVAEAGRGALAPEECVTPPGPPEEPAEPLCLGPTGAITLIDRLNRAEPRVERVVEGLRSVAGPNGAFATGTNGVDEIDVDLFAVAQSPGLVGEDPADTDQGAYFAAPAEAVPAEGEDEGEIPPDALFELPGGDVALLAANLHEAEVALNPDTAQIESNPYALLFVDEDEDNDEDGYVLVADAAANTVWRVEPLAEGEDPPAGAVVSSIGLVTTVFATFPVTPPADGEERAPEFVPTSLAPGRAPGTVLVGGLGSEVPDAASVVEFDLATGEETQTWTGFTGVVGVATDGDSLYVSQLFGSTPPAPPGESPQDEVPVEDIPPATIPGSVLRVELESGAETEAAVPFPGGVLADGNGGVYVAANSVAPAEGVTEVFGPGSPDLEGGQVWQVGAELFTEPTPPEEPEPTWPPASTHGAFLPLPEEALTPLTAEVCGDTVTFAPGDVREVKYRSLVDGDGNTVVEFRGASTMDITRESDGAMLDEVDTSGSGFETYSADGSTVTFDYEGASVVVAFDERESQVFEEAGFPPEAFLYLAGRLTETVTFSTGTAEPGHEAPEVVEAEIVENTTRYVFDICDLLDQAAADRGEVEAPAAPLAVDPTV